MSIRTRVEPIDLNVDLNLAEELSPEGRSATLAAFARAQLEEARAVNQRALGRVPDHETFVDGRAGAPVESVRPDGRIVFEFEILLDLFAWIGEQLVQHSPVRSGRYAASHAFYAGGVQMEPGAAVPEAQEYVFLNLQPFARKIERGLSAQAPDGVFQAVATLASRRFGNIARIRFGYREPMGGAVGEWAGRTTMTRRGRSMSARARADWLTRQPAIIITLGR